MVNWQLMSWTLMYVIAFVCDNKCCSTAAVNSGYDHAKLDTGEK